MAPEAAVHGVVRRLAELLPVRAEGMKSHATGVQRQELRPEVRRKISVAFRRGEQDHPAVRVSVEEVVRTAARVLPSQ